jgi:serine/threonine protein phosphatase 1
MIGRLLAVGDIHGCFDPFREMVENKLKLRKKDKLILLGDYIDRGYKSKEVVDFIINLQKSGFDIVPLIGNHESMLLDSLDDEHSLSGWFINGGNETLYSFGIESVKELGDEYIHFFRNLSYYYSSGKFLFVHAGFNDALIDPFKDKTQMIWARREIYSNPAFKDRIIVHGHTPIPLSFCQELVKSDSRVLNIDTGCVYGEIGGYGHLAAIELNSGELFSV